MNRRLGLIAVSGLDSYGLADRFPTVPDERFASSIDWAWLRFDLDEPIAESLAPEEVAARLGKLKGLALDIRAEPGDHWRMSLYPPRGKPLRVAFHHELYLLPATPAGARAKLSAADELARLDERLPEPFHAPGSVLAEARGKPAAKGLAALKKAIAAQVAGVLDRSGLNPEVITELAGEQSTADELRAPHGTLPKFLDAVGLGKAWVEHDGTWKVGVFIDSVGSCDRRRHLYALAPEARPIGGGPADLPATDLSRFWLLPWFCETDSETDILITPPAGSRVPLPKTESWVTIHRRGRQAYVEVVWNPPGARYRVFRALGQALAASPAGTVVEFLAANTSYDEDDPSYVPPPEGRQRYVGTLTGQGTFRVTHASPAMAAADLTAAMELCRQIDEDKPSFEMPSEADAAAVVAMARGTSWFGGEKDLPRARGRMVVPANKDERLTTAMMAFRRRFAAGPWQTAAGQQRDQESHEEWEDMIDEVGKTVGEALAAPAGGDVILRTEVATYRHADWSKMNVGVLDAFSFLWGQAVGEDVETPQTPVEKLEPVDRAMSGLGFTSLGDVHCDRLGELHLRGYAGPDGDAFGCVAAGTFGQFVFEFVTRFSDGGTLTTTTTPRLKDQKKRRIFKRSYPDLDPEALYEKHRAGIAEIRSEKAQPLPVDATIEGFCRALDDYVKREM